jgi:hypothetical protein
MSDRVETALNQGSRIFQPHLEESLSPLPVQSTVQKSSKETRQLQQLFLNNANGIKLSSNLAAASIVLHNSLATLHPWNSSNSEILEKIENHAEALLSDSSFVITFKEWCGLDELKHFCNDKKWWKRQAVKQNPPPSRPLSRRYIRIARDSSVESSQPPTRASSTDIASADLSMDDLTMETPVLPRTAQKGTSVLRPSMSVSQTPGTPTKPFQRETGSVSSSVLIDLTNTDEDELQLLKVPPDISTRIEEKQPAKRKFKVHNDETIRPSRKTRLDTKGNPTKIDPQSNLTRAPLTAVIVPPSLKCLM